MLLLFLYKDEAAYRCPTTCGYFLTSCWPPPINFVVERLWLSVGVVERIMLFDWDGASPFIVLIVDFVSLFTCFRLYCVILLLVPWIREWAGTGDNDLFKQSLIESDGFWSWRRIGRVGVVLVVGFALKSILDLWRSCLGTICTLSTGMGDFLACVEVFNGFWSEDYFWDGNYFFVKIGYFSGPLVKFCNGVIGLTIFFPIGFF